ncbi:tRNA (adenosine(37)-N6)-threonylcarbamoyltransferase complex ATPase subunit type 1 TsaE [Rhodovarius crocodyli]|uniref:tRNA threonylcarbamoyladenosine biosynthesis protein TsaE n=1 Tax=Rhodovarius crocodyli TaxID=1979269 RepID=A0A437M394_9PROT|nr:tRNA (adenosine(37)-N6)-threonylcarbamoyltransferase complex ATPase subunit type 1 TsaE [Rhodovarius crocodyli]RVT92169.1 tRNA (adenosine(37)-N6)-threonylcarbamoyltransferase complex ATPase subunit type 1 TsaE [Rhodovarius crocodyli]
MMLENLAATEALAARLAALARPGDAILLSGELGAGKSAFARAFLRAAAGDPALEVPSPTFTLVQSYALPGGGQVHHLDLYRLGDASELAELGFEELAQDIMLIEWPERMDETPPGALRLQLSILDDDRREARLDGWEGRL